jgi:hypothetical protein
VRCGGVADRVLVHGLEGIFVVTFDGRPPALLVAEAQLPGDGARVNKRGLRDGDLVAVLDFEGIPDGVLARIHEGAAVATLRITELD